MIRKYLDNALIMDLILCVFLCSSIIIFKLHLKDYFYSPKDEIILKFVDSVIKLGATLIGFLLTILSVIITFRNAFQNQKPAEVPKTEVVTDTPVNTVFDKKNTKKEKFYNSDIHKKVMKVFLNAVYEMGIVVFSFLAIQSGYLHINHFWTIMVAFLGFISLSLAVIRSFYIYGLFIKVHLED